MAKYECMVCGWIYDEDLGDPDSGIVAGTKFDDLPDDWVCPMCGAAKEDFEPIQTIEGRQESHSGTPVHSLFALYESLVVSHAILF